ncbi:MAG TPA: hypothetical protein VK081_09495 [Planctomycetota bacterium]|nr:hypothetical protein [Planctomycetota bacterium]
MTVRFRRPLALAAVATLLAASPQDPAAPAHDRFVLEAGEHDLVRVIAASARFLGRNYLLSPAELPSPEPKVTLQRRLDLDEEGCEAVVSQLAYANGLVAVPLDRERGLWEFVSLRGAKAGEAMARALVLPPDEVRRMRAVRVFVTTRVDLANAPAGMVAQSLRPFLAGVSHATTIGAGSDRTLLLSGMAEDVARALELVAALDQAPGVPRVPPDRFVALEERVAALEKAIELLRK